MQHVGTVEQTLSLALRAAAGLPQSSRRSHASLSSSVLTSRGHGLDLGLDGVGIDAVLGEEFFGFAGMRHFQDGELMDFDALAAKLTGHGVAQAAFGVVVLDGENEVIGLLGGALDDVWTSGLML